MEFMSSWALHLFLPWFIWYLSIAFKEKYMSYSFYENKMHLNSMKGRRIFAPSMTKRASYRLNPSADNQLQVTNPSADKQLCIKT